MTTPHANREWFRRKVRELGHALAALSPARRELALDTLTDATGTDKESERNRPPRTGARQGTPRGGRTMRPAKGNGR